MSQSPTLVTLLLVAGLFTAAPLSAQHEHGASPYAHTQSDRVPSLSPEEVAQLENGEGMGLARAAELNHYPGPKHLLELAEELGLTSDQREHVESVRATMAAQAVALGARILQAEQHLSDLFAGGSATRAEVDRITGHIGGMRGELRAVHLGAHIEVTRVLREEQVEEYDRLRGYTPRP